jgi:hypothetical protein
MLLAHYTTGQRMTRSVGLRVADVSLCTAVQAATTDYGDAHSDFAVARQLSEITQEANSLLQ